MQVRENFAAYGQRQGRRVQPRSSGACSFRDFFGRNIGEIDHLENSRETGRAMKYNA
jgi:hypothetical protein